MHRYAFIPAAILGAALCAAAHAGTVTTINDTTDDIAYTGSSPTGWFGGSAQGDVIGSNFDASRIVVTEAGGAHGALNLTFQISTQFSGTDCFGSTCAYNADLFLRTPSKGYSSAPFNYAVALGGQAPNGGYAAPGLYAVSSFETSQDLWASRGGFIYGGEYVPHDDSAASELAPTVLTGGFKLADATYVQTGGPDNYTDTILLTATGPEAQALRNGFDVFWGTGDCANDSIFGSVAPVPEPATLAILGMSVVTLTAMRTRFSRRPMRARR